MSSVNVKVDGDVQRLMKRLGRIAGVDKAGINNTIAEGLRTSTICLLYTSDAADE